MTTRQRTRQVKLALPGPKPSWSEPFVHPTGRLVAANVSGHGMLFWNAATGDRLGLVARGLSSSTGTVHPTRDLYFSASNATRADPKGSPVEVVAYDVAAKTYVTAFRGGHTAGIEVIAVSADGSRMATGDSAGQARLWDPRSVR